MDLSALALSKQYTNKVAAGITAARVEDNTIILTLVDGSEARCNLPAPKDGTNGQDGVSVIDLSIDNDGSLLCHMSDGSTIDAGYVPIADVKLEDYYTKEEINELSDDCYFVYLKSAGKTDEYNLAQMNKAIKYFSKKPIVIILNANTRGSSIAPRVFCMEYTTITDLTNYTGSLDWYSERTIVGQDDSTQGVYLEEGCSIIGVKITNGVVTEIDTDRSRSVTTEDFKLPVLSTSGKMAFTPTTDYHPATKKYVDDSITEINIPEVNLTDYYTKEEVNEAIENIDIPEVDLSNYYKKSEIGNITSLVGWRSDDTAISYFNRNPGIYDMLITSSIDDPATTVTVSGSNLKVLLQMVKNHEDKCF